MQKLEDSVLKDTDSPPLRGSPPTKVPAKVREIVTANLSTEDLQLPQPGNMAAPNVDQLQEENRMLQTELNRIEDLLSATRAERDEIGIKYNAIADRVSTSSHCLFLRMITKTLRGIDPSRYTITLPGGL